MTADLDRWREIAAKYDYYHGIRGVWAEDNIMLMLSEAACIERESCATLCDDMALYTGVDCAAAIRQAAQADSKEE